MAVRGGLAAALAAMLAMLAIPAPAFGRAPAPAAAARIMVVGSSTSHGSSGDYTWRYRLWRHLTSAGVAVDFVGPSNRLYDNVHSTSGSFLESDAYADPAFDRDHASRWGKFVGTFGSFPPGAKDTIGADVATYQPDYVIIMLGLNDLVWFPSRDPSLIAADMKTTITRARAARPNVGLLLAAVQPTKSQLDDPTLAARTASYNQLLEGLAASESTSTSPIAYAPRAVGYQPNYEVSPHDSYDGTHPNARGEHRIADTIADVLSARFGLGPAYALNLSAVPVGPVLPFGLRCTPGDSMVTLTWDESPGATGYWFQRRIAGGEWDPQVYQLTLADRPLDNIWLLNGVTYEYRLQAAKWYDRGITATCSVTPSA
jgi:hypothetical protein